MARLITKNIQNEILRVLLSSCSTIKVAVAWFTNDILFLTLISKLKQGVSVELVVNDDSINRSEDSNVDFDEFVDSGGILHWVPASKLMHQKFCIVDNRLVLNGSYNWTNKAEYNSENITLFDNDTQIVADFNSQFSQLCRQYPCVAKRREVSRIVTEPLVVKSPIVHAHASAPKKPSRHRGMSGLRDPFFLDKEKLDLEMDREKVLGSVSEIFNFKIGQLEQPVNRYIKKKFLV